MKNLKKILLGMAVMMTLALCLTPATAVHAEDDYEIEYVKNGFKKTFEFNPYEWPQMNFEAFRKGGVKNAKVKISNKKILSAKIYEDDSVAPGYAWMSVIPKKPGKTKVTITATVKGKNITCKGTITIAKFQKGFSKLKIGGKNYLKRITCNDVFINIVDLNNKNLKLEYELSPGWKIKSVEMFNRADEGTNDYTPKFKSGAYLPPGGYHVYLENTKTKISHLVRILPE